MYVPMRRREARREAGREARREAGREARREAGREADQQSRSGVAEIGEHRG